MDSVAREQRLSSRPRWVNWLFADRRTGRIVIAQWPNLPLWAFLVSAAVQRVFHFGGAVGSAISAISITALAVWAFLEIGWGVNPFRRLLGAAVLVGEVVSVARSLPIH